MATTVESISVPAGTYQVLRLEHNATSTPLDYEDAPHQTMWTEWVAQGVGTVKDDGQSLELAAISTSGSSPSASECADLQMTIDSLRMNASQRADRVMQDLSQMDQLSVAATADVAAAVANGSVPAGQLGQLQAELAQLAMHLTAFHSAWDNVMFDEPVQSLGRQLFADATVLIAQAGGVATVSALHDTAKDLLQAMSVGQVDQTLIAGFTSARQGCP